MSLYYFVLLCVLLEVLTCQMDLITFIVPLYSPQLQRLAPPAAQDRRCPPLPKPAQAAPCPHSSVTLSTRTVFSESFVSSVPWWQTSAATTPRHRLLRSFSKRAQVEVGVFIILTIFAYVVFVAFLLLNVFYTSFQISSMEICTSPLNCFCQAL